MTRWVEHSEAAREMGLSARQTFETYDGWPAMVRACRERTAALLVELDRTGTIRHVEPLHLPVPG